MTKYFIKSASLISVLAIVSINSLNAQDIIHRKNGKKIETKITEIGVNEVKYKDFNNLEGPTYTIEKNYVKQIVFENGKVEKYNQEHYDSEDTEWYLDNRKNAIKISMLGPLLGYTEISLERNVKVGQSYEVSLGGIGLGKNRILSQTWNPTQDDIYYSQRGVFVSGGYKFGNMPSFVFFGKPRQKHLFHGTYIKPIVYLGHYSENQIVNTHITSIVERQKVLFGNVNIEFGKQWEFANKVVFDVYFGAGYGFDNKKSEFSDAGNTVIADHAFNYVTNRFGKAPGFSVSFGAKFGILFDMPKKK